MTTRVKTDFIFQPKTLVELLERRAQAGPGRYTFLDANGDPYCVLDYPALCDAAERLAGRLQQTCEVGSRVVLLYPTGPEFLKALFGCFFAGMVAVPLPMPDYATLKRTVARLQAVALDADPAVILCHSSAYKLLKPHLNFEYRRRRGSIPPRSWPKQQGIASLFIRTPVAWHICNTPPVLRDRRVG